MTKAEKNYKRDYGHKDSEELALNYTRDGMREELDKVLSEVSPNDLTADEQEYLNGRDQCRNHTLNIRFNDTEWEHICKQAELLHVRKSSYVCECAKAQIAERTVSICHCDTHRPRSYPRPYRYK